MSLFDDLLFKIKEISDDYTLQLNKRYEEAILILDKFAENSKNSRRTTLGKEKKHLNPANILHSINEVEDETYKTPPGIQKSNSKASHVSELLSTDSDSQSSVASEPKSKRAPKKRSNDEILDRASSPEQGKRPKRNGKGDATRRTRKTSAAQRQSRSRKKSGSVNKENCMPLQVQVKLEKTSLPPQQVKPIQISTDNESNADIGLMPPPQLPILKMEKTRKRNTHQRGSEIEEKELMPPPATLRETRSSRASRRNTKQVEEPVIEPRPKRTRTLKKGKKTSQNESTEDSQDNQTPSLETRSSRASRRNTKQVEEVLETRPKRTRTLKKAAMTVEQETIAETTPTSPRASAAANKATDIASSESRPKRTRTLKRAAAVASEEEKLSQESVDNVHTSSPETTTLKRTKRTKKAVPAQNTAKNDPTELISPKKEQVSISQELLPSPVLQISKIPKPKTTKTKAKPKGDSAESENSSIESKNPSDAIDTADVANTNNPSKDKSPKTSDRLLKNIDISPILEIKSKNKSNKPIEMANDNIMPDNDEGNKVVLNSTYVTSYNEKVVPVQNGLNLDFMEKKLTIALEKYDINTQQHAMNETFVCNKDAEARNVTEDLSIMTEDNSAVGQEPDGAAPQEQKKEQPLSAVKVKVQQFEEMASRTTRTQTKLNPKQDDQADNFTPPDKISKPILSSETLKKMDQLIFNGKHPTVTKSACKPTVQTAAKYITSSASKVAYSKANLDFVEKNFEDPRIKKQAMLEKKKEEHRIKREEKMAKANAARERAARERNDALAAALAEREAKMRLAQTEREERMREQDKKKQEAARKALEIEERRRAEEKAKQQRLTEERKMEEVRKKKMIEAEKERKEAEVSMKMIEQKKKEYLLKQKKMAAVEKTYQMNIIGTPNSWAPPVPMDPVYMEDGFQHLCEDPDSDKKFPVPAWSRSQMYRPRVACQEYIHARHVDSLFSVRLHSPDLREIFPNVDRRALKRTSSAVWRTPPSARMPVVEE